MRDYFYFPANMQIILFAWMESTTCLVAAWCLDIVAEHNVGVWMNYLILGSKTCQAHCLVPG